MLGRTPSLPGGRLLGLLRHPAVLSPAWPGRAPPVAIPSGARRWASTSLGAWWPAAVVFGRGTS
eukprot:6650097-Lingulodinium_polyedra.AAC.1